MLLKNVILVGTGGMIGSVLRYFTTFLIRNDSLPYATFIINMAGSLLIGMVMGVASRQEGFASWRLFLATGVCGGFTTFSAFAWENLQLLNQQRYAALLMYAGGSVVAGLAVVSVGYWLTK